MARIVHLGMYVQGVVGFRRPTGVWYSRTTVAVGVPAGVVVRVIGPDVDMAAVQRGDCSTTPQRTFHLDATPTTLAISGEWHQSGEVGSMMVTLVLVYVGTQRYTRGPRRTRGRPAGTLHAAGRRPCRVAGGETAVPRP